MHLQDVLIAAVFFLHFLVVASALVGCSCSNVDGHRPKDFIRSSQLGADELFGVVGQEQVIKSLFTSIPMPNIDS
jgi:hypothetical protein